jgi:hypothetical protein
LKVLKLLKTSKFISEKDNNIFNIDPRAKKDLSYLKDTENK